SHVSLVQAFPSLQSPAVAQGVQPAIGLLLQTPASHVSVVQAFPSLQSVAVVQSLQPAMGVLLQEPESTAQESAVQGFRSSQEAASVQFGWALTQASPESPPVPL